MNIISIHWNINSSVALMIDSKIMEAVSEERFTRLKNDMSFPKQSIDYILNKYNLSKDDIDYWLFSSLGASKAYHLIRRYDNFSISDYIKEQDEFWYPKLYKNDKVDFLNLFKDKIDFSQFPSDYWKKQINEELELLNPNEDFRITILRDYMDIAEDKIKCIEHHPCHTAYAYYSSPFVYKEKVLALTIDGIGDGLNATVTIINEQGDLKRVYKTNKANLGRLYRWITLLLGMKPNEHEYKMMGLAPYSKNNYSQEVLEIFEDYIYIEDGEFKFKNEPKDLYYFYREKFKHIRFDNIAGGVQRFVEKILEKWIDDLIEIHGINTIIICGGVAMNIKAMGNILANTKVKKLFVPGNPGDETNCIGAAYYYNNSCNNKNKTLKSLYLGPKASVHEKNIEYLKKNNYKLIYDPSNKEIISYIEAYNVIGRCIGKMEFGARALGNRSILARSDKSDIKERINHMIKNRDFWMPFAPIILDKFADEYLINPKKAISPYMTIGFSTTLKGMEVLKAALHPADKTIRPQILYKDQNPELYTFIDQYHSQTGFGGMLNTSFNLHGYPIVNTSDDAISVFEKSDLDGLWLDNLLVLKEGI